MSVTAPFDFSRFLSPAEQLALGNTARWRWISSLGLQSHRPVRHPVHEAWARRKGNTHCPAYREIMLTLRGGAVYSINGRAYMRHPGTVILLESNDTRDLKGAPAKVNFSCLWLHLHTRDHLTYYVNTCDQRGRYTHELGLRTKSGEVPRRITDAWDHCRCAPGDKLAAALLKSAVACTLLEILGGPESPQPGGHHEQVIQAVTDYVHRHPDKKLGLQHLARIAGYSPFFFHRLFVRHTGQTPAQYVAAIRLSRATELLAKNLTVGAVAEAVGFASASHFHQFFKKRLHRTPRHGRHQASGTDPQIAPKS